MRSYFILLLVLMLALWGMNWVMGTESLTSGKSSRMVSCYDRLPTPEAGGYISYDHCFAANREGEGRNFSSPRGSFRRSQSSLVKAEKNTGKHAMFMGNFGTHPGNLSCTSTLLFFGLGNLPSTNILDKGFAAISGGTAFCRHQCFFGRNTIQGSYAWRLAQRIVGPDQAIWLTATYFGFAHYFGGAPSGIPGVLITGLLGALFARCMLGSKGIVVPWFIHFCQNGSSLPFG